MQVLEQFTQSKTGDDSFNEDAIAITPDFIAVIDGATSRGGDTLQGISNGRFAATVLSNAISSLKTDIEGVAAISYLTNILRLEAEKAALAEGKTFHDPWSYPAAALMVYSRARHEIWRVADPSFMIDGGEPNYRTFPQEANLAELRRAHLHAHLLRGLTEAQMFEKDPTWDMVSPLIASLKIFANNQGPYSYGVMNGNPVPLEHIEIFDARDGKEFVFASDGYPEIFPDFAATEKHLQETVRHDPLMYKIYPQVKGMKKGHVSFDDRTYVRFRV